MVSPKSISLKLTLSQDKGLDVRLIDGARGVRLGDASVCRLGATVPGSTFPKPMPPPPLDVSGAQVEDRSHPH